MTTVVFVRQTGTDATNESARAAVRSWCARTGVPVPSAWYEEPARPNRRSPRPVLTALLEDCRERRVRVVVAPSFRDLADRALPLLVVIARLLDAGAVVIVIGESYRFDPPAARPHRLFGDLVRALTEFDAAATGRWRPAGQPPNRGGRPAWIWTDADQRRFDEQRDAGLSVYRIAEDGLVTAALASGRRGIPCRRWFYELPERRRQQRLAAERRTS